MTENAPQSIVDALRSDHESIRALLHDTAATEDTPDGLAAREQLVMALMRHFVAEEQYLDPTIRAELAGGGRIADDSFAADRESENALRLLEDEDIGMDRIHAVWQELIESFGAHVARQEPVLTELAETCDAAQLAELGEGVLGAEQLAPTRPRTVATSSAAANKVISFVEGYLDHVRDYYTKRGVTDRD
ncbi:MAG: hypothetical protein ACR2KJ_11815 [Jatrophihabitans sp.]